jgi:hypothetical protein
MSPESMDALMTRIMDQYNRKPEGWTVLVDFKGNVLVMGPNGGYRLKMIHLNPHEYTGVGVKIDDTETVQRLVEGAPSYGLRPLSRKHATTLLTRFHEGAFQSKVVRDVLAMKPVSTWALEKKKPQAFLSGPIITHPDLATISSNQRKLEAKLAAEAEKLFRTKYPHRAAIYG